MIIEVIGVGTVLAGLWVLWQGPVAAFWVLGLSALLGAAAAFKVPALGDASVPPVLVVALFLAISVALRPRLREAAIESSCAVGSRFLAAVVYRLRRCIRLFHAAAIPRPYLRLFSCTKRH